MKRKWLWVLGLTLLSLWLGVLGVAGGVFLDREVLARSAPSTIPTAAAPDFKLLNQAWNTIQQDYVDRAALQPEQLTYGAISGMVDALGDTGHSRFMTPKMVKQEQDFTQGQFEGIGAEVQIKDHHLTIVAPMDGSPAQQAGLHPGDVILKVDGQELAALPLDQAVGRILGPAGSKVTLTILDPTTGSQRDVEVVRARIALHPVTWLRLPGTTIAHVRIASFSQGVTDDLQKALKEIQAAGLTGVILDLRSDPGGLLDEAVGVVSQFLKDGNVLQEKNAQGEAKPVPVKGGGVALDVYEEEKTLAVALRQGAGPAAANTPAIAATLALAGRADVILTPHNAFNTHESLARKAAQSVESVLHFLKTGAFPNPVPRE